MHTCPDCYAICMCCGDIDDCDWGEWGGCKHYRECEAEDDDYLETSDEFNERMKRNGQ